MKIKYKWKANSEKPEEANCLTLERQHVPALGDPVSLKVMLAKDKVICVTGRVTERHWHESHHEQCVTLTLGE